MYTTNCGMLSLGDWHTFRGPTLKEWKGLSVVKTFRPGKDLLGSTGGKTPQAEGISWGAALSWVRARHTEKLRGLVQLEVGQAAHAEP